MNAKEAAKALHAAMERAIDARVPQIVEGILAKRVAPAGELDRAQLEEIVRAELKGLPIPRYCGVWDAAKEYPVGSLVTRRGSLWHCEVATSEAPGTGKGWRMVVKQGDPGRMARAG
jgi:hypothetical protein